jgi:para-nitrobenzyl esterase
MYGLIRIVFRRCGPLSSSGASGTTDNGSLSDRRIGQGRSQRRIFTSLVLLTMLAPLCRAASADLSGGVKTSSGELIGIERPGVREFLGVPYAAPPTGDLRWRPPQSLELHAPLKADTLPPPCPQNSPSLFAQPSATEDCLYLNIFAPKLLTQKLPRSSSSGLPVMVWFHGGGLFSGSSADYDGSQLARDGHVIVVTVNYRLGVLGFLYHPETNEPGGGAANDGLLDQQLALQWIHKNIAAFGGDSGSVTLFGQSSGATSVVAHLVAPGSQGLFQRAIIQSAVRLAPLPKERALALSESFFKAVGCSTQSLSCLRALPVQTLLDHQRELVTQAAAYFFVLDGATLSQAPLQAFRDGLFNKVPVINGLTADEQAYFLPEASSGIPLTRADYVSWAKALGGDAAQAIVDRYPVDTYGSPSLAEIAAAQDSKRCVALKLDSVLSTSVPVYAYEFADRQAPSYFPERSYPMGAFHTAELQYLFPLFHGARGQTHALSTQQEALARDMVRLWSSFAREGVPRTPQGAGWSPFDPALRNQLVLAPGHPAGTAKRPSAGKETSEHADCQFWDPINGL